MCYTGILPTQFETFRRNYCIHDTPVKNPYAISTSEVLWRISCTPIVTSRWKSLNLLLRIFLTPKTALVLGKNVYRFIYILWQTQRIMKIDDVALYLHKQICTSFLALFLDYMYILIDDINMKITREICKLCNPRIFRNILCLLSYIQYLAWNFRIR